MGVPDSMTSIDASSCGAFAPSKTLSTQSTADFQTSTPSDTESDVADDDFALDTDDDVDEGSEWFETQGSDDSAWYRHLAARLARTAVVTDMAETDAEVDAVVAEMASMAMTIAVTHMEAHEAIPEEQHAPKAQDLEPVVRNESDATFTLVRQTAGRTTRALPLDALIAVSFSADGSPCAFPPPSSLDACERRCFKRRPCPRSRPEPSSSSFTCSSSIAAATSLATCPAPPPLKADWTALNTLAALVVSNSQPLTNRPVVAARRSAHHVQPAVPQTPARTAAVTSSLSAVSPSGSTAIRSPKERRMRPSSRTSKRAVRMLPSKRDDAGQTSPVLSGGKLHRKPVFAAHRLDLSDSAATMNGAATQENGARDSSLARGYEVLGVEHFAIDDGEDPIEENWFSGLDGLHNPASTSPARSVQVSVSAMAQDLGVVPPASSPVPPTPSPPRSASTGSFHRVSKLCSAPAGVKLAQPFSKAVNLLPALHQVKHRPMYAPEHMMPEHTIWGLAASKAQWGSVSAVF